MASLIYFIIMLGFIIPRHCVAISSHFMLSFLKVVRVVFAETIHGIKPNRMLHTIVIYLSEHELLVKITCMGYIYA